MTIVGHDFCPPSDAAERVVLYHCIPPPSTVSCESIDYRLSRDTYFLCRNIAYVLCIFLIDCMIFFALLLVTHVYVVQQMLQSLWTVRHTHHHHPTTTTYQQRF